MATVQDFALRVLTRAKVIDPGEGATSSELGYALTEINSMLGSWSAMGMPLYQDSHDTYALTGAASVTMGPSGTITIARPLKIKAASIVVGNVSGKLEIITADQWAAIEDRSRSGKFADVMYCDGGFPDVTLYFAPTPASGGSLQIHSLKALAEFSSLSDTFALPPGYDRALANAMAMDMAIAFGIAVPPELAAAAQEGMAAIAGLNAAVLGTPAPAAAPQK